VNWSNFWKAQNSEKSGRIIGGKESIKVDKKLGWNLGRPRLKQAGENKKLKLKLTRVKLPRKLEL